ncbi:m7G(5')pppN diphosphatase [Aureococcus anophagefferens]|nr:m7G(5')pppN diphosphatase [Aureococcus anophagefferens]
MVRRYVGNGVWEDVPGTVTPQNSLEVALEDVATRFLTHLPATELRTADRLFFQIEQAHWFYEDFLADAPGAKLPHLHLGAFAEKLFESCELLKPMKEAFPNLMKDFRAYKNSIPVCGCVLLDPSLTRVVLVCNWAKTSWGLPKGKLNQHEAKYLAAKREVLEETGYDVGYDMGDEDCIEVMNKKQNAAMFCVPDVPLDYPFEPRVRKEISEVKFFPIDELPAKQWNVDIFVRPPGPPFEFDLADIGQAVNPILDAAILQARQKLAAGGA